MKKLNLLMFYWCFCLLGMVAAPIDETQALSSAQAFLKNKRTATGARRYAPGRLPQIKLAGQVNGLYVYNVSNDGGFVIVSNDDATIPVLGFSEGGSIDIDRIPSNMKAWLKGYADEIAWYQKHGTKLAKLVRKAQAGSHSTDAISPLLTTKWNQDEPFNNLMPLADNGDKCATGCAATAMAQVMYYHKWPQSETEFIHGYTTTTSEYNLPGLPATTFDWANMKDDYQGGYTKKEGAAVAKLMQYCGYSMEMDYGPSSAAYDRDLLEALKKYFDYSETTQMAVRSCYSAGNWADLIYHELANKRPVLYTGYSSGGGHAFVCDGYKYEDETDFFHINWGWGGMSDEYFVLSALDPHLQGIGGSLSNDGYRIGQEAIIGIQPSTGTGTIADIPTTDINLTVNSAVADRNPVYVGVPVNMVLNITNNSAEDFDGTIFLGYQYQVADSVDNDLINGDVFYIPAGETKDIVISFTPWYEGTLDLVTFMPQPTGGYRTNNNVVCSLDVKEAETNAFVPLYSNEDNELSRSQFIIPAANLQDMQYANLNSMTLYFVNTFVSAAAPIDWGAAEFDVYLAEVSEPTFTDAVLKDWNSMEKKYSGRLTAFQGQMKIAFDAPFQYMGGNLLVGFKQTLAGDTYENEWFGTIVPGASLGGSSNETTPVIQRDFLPLTSFEFTAGTAPTVAKPVALFVNETSGTTAEVKWTSTESAWDIEVNGTVTENVTNPYTLTNLEPATIYTVRVRAKNGSDVSDWSAPTTFHTDLSDESCQIRFELADAQGDGWDGAAIKVVDKKTGVVISTISNTDKAKYGVAQSYTVDVPVGRDISLVWIGGVWDEYCSYLAYDWNGDIILSGSGTVRSTPTYYVDGLPSSWHRPSDVTVSNIAPHSADLNWKENGDATAWVVAYKIAEDDEYTEVNVDATTLTLTGLTADTAYIVKVRPATDEATKWSAEVVFDTNIPNPAPTTLSVTPRPTTADLSWEGFTDSYEVRYGVLPRTVLQYDNDTYRGNWGYENSRTLTWGVKYPNSEVEGKLLTKVAWYEVSGYYEGDITVNIYSGDNVPSQLLYTRNVKPTVNGGFHELTLPVPVAVVPEQNLWIMLTAKGTKVISYCQCDESDNQWIYKDGEYVHLADLKSSYASFGYMIRGYMETPLSAIDESTFEWTTTASSEQTCQLTGLTPETDYVVQVRGDFGEEGISEWTETKFTTIALDAVPNSLKTTDITSNSATLTWTGYQDSYDLRYKVKKTTDLVQDFDDSSFGDWTTIDADGDGYGWEIYSQDTQYYMEGMPGGDVCTGMGRNGSVDKAISGSYSALDFWYLITPDNYLISPKVRLGGTISFWAYSDDPDIFMDHFGIAVSTKGNTDVADFTTIQEWTMDEGLVWKKFTADLSAYDGQEGYVAIRHFDCTYQSIVSFDDIVIEIPDAETPWTVVNNISGDSYELTGLTEQTEYIAQVCGRTTPSGNTTKWSWSTGFTTLEGGATGIRTTDFTDTQNSKLTSGWFSIDGRRLNSRPTKKGVYIHNGKKVVK